MITPVTERRSSPTLTQELYHPFAVASIFSCYADPWSLSIFETARLAAVRGGLFTSTGVVYGVADPAVTVASDAWRVGVT